MIAMEDKRPLTKGVTESEIEKLYGHLPHMITGQILNHGLETHLPKTFPMFEDIIFYDEEYGPTLHEVKGLTDTIQYFILYAKQFNYSEAIEGMSGSDFAACMYIKIVAFKIVIKYS